MVNKAGSADIAVFFDFENIVYSLRNRLGQNPNFELLMDKCQEYGRVVLAQAYADWVRHSSIIAPLQSSGFDPIYVPTYVYADPHNDRKARKNAVDICIAVDAMEVLFTQPHIQIFILLSGDKDFVPLANTLRRHGKQVIFLGVKGTTSAHVRQAVDDLIFYHELTDEIASEQKAPKDIYQELKKAVQILTSNGKRTDLYSVEHTLTELLGSFDEHNYTDQDGQPFKRFKDFILDAQRQGHVCLVTSGVVNEVRLPQPGQSPAQLEAQPPVVRAPVIRAPVIRAPVPPSQPEPQPAPAPAPAKTELETAFELLVQAAVQAQTDEKSPRAANIKNVMRRLHKGFDEKKLKSEKGETFTNFSEFARLAARRGYVNVSGKGIYLEILPSEKQPEPGQVLDLPQPESHPVVEPAKPPLPLGNIEQDGIPIAASALPPAKPEPVSEYRMRALLLDALRSCKYPAPAYAIGQHCQKVRDQRQIQLPNNRLYQLMTAAKEIGLIEEADEVEPNAQVLYIFCDNPDLAEQFLSAED